jgi:mRNA-degrading endonuclease YafQ of YafQ-DinJ toxin-antitoxin module
MYKILLSDKYIKKEKSFIKKHPDLKERYGKTLSILKENPHHPSLRLHKLKGTLKEYHSISISMSYRVVLELIITDEEIILMDIGTHSEVYK